MMKTVTMNPSALTAITAWASVATTIGARSTGSSKYIVLTTLI